MQGRFPFLRVVCGGIGKGRGRAPRPGGDLVLRLCLQSAGAALLGAMHAYSYVCKCRGSPPPWSFVILCLQLCLQNAGAASPLGTLYIYSYVCKVHVQLTSELCTLFTSLLARCRGSFLWTRGLVCLQLYLQNAGAAPPPPLELCMSTAFFAKSGPAPLGALYVRLQLGLQYAGEAPPLSADCLQLSWEVQWKVCFELACSHM